MRLLRRLLLWGTRAGGGAAFNYYIDSVAGSDSNDGTSEAAPWATIGKLTSAAVLANGVKIGLAYGGEWGETLDLSTYTGTVVGAYGDDTQPLPTIYGSDVAPKSGWTLSGGRTKAYERSWTHTVNTSAVGQISVWKRLTSDTTGGWTLLTYTTSAANCESTANSFFVVSPINNSTVTVYLHPAGDTDPNGDTYDYRVTKRDYAVRMGDTSSITRVCTMMQGHNDGSMTLRDGTYAYECMNLHGHKHNAIGYDWRSCVFYQAEGSSRISTASLAVAYSGTPTGLSAQFIDCFADGGPTFAGDLLYGHSAGVVKWVEQKIERFSGRRGANGLSVGNTSSHVLRDSTIEQVLTTGMASAADNVTIDNVTMILSVAHNGNTPRRAVDLNSAAGGSTITDLRAYLTRQTSGGAIYGFGLLTITNSSIQLDSASYDIAFDTGWATGSIFTNNIVVGPDLLYGWTASARQPGVGTDYNVYYKASATPDYSVNSTTYTTLAAYQAAFPTLDANTVGTDPLLASPSTNDWTLGGASPANTGGRNSGSRKHIALPDWTTLNANWDKRYLGFNGHIAP